ncbi:hypothetical protein Y88_2563 [Novosphingobium nitrogenifigens DSM 19370]|uniref:17 kDa surface antigen n=1 Tax=Novosphingobium nitrogenifigens DSM 19370 TaxID=983920 RepID=F1Z6W9_9SPHN|nr:glycine zipper 2TM domain-containing protein [Novosphingobium nitrogenifigens]EGD59779.1 hypothetical protein Y88_2563 [Novosphingobium nitrogenifigens DSM 19370]
MTLKSNSLVVRAALGLAALAGVVSAVPAQAVPLGGYGAPAVLQEAGWHHGPDHDWDRGHGWGGDRGGWGHDGDWDRGGRGWDRGWDRGRGWEDRGFGRDYHDGYRGDWHRSNYYYDGPSWRGRDGRYYCRRSDGTTGLLIGGVAGALIGRGVAGPYGDRTLGTVLGAAGGALIGHAIDRNNVSCR